MGQAEILKFLRKHRGKRYSNAELGRAMKVQSNIVNISTNKLIEFKLLKSQVVRVKSRFIVNGKAHYYKRQIRKVYL